MVRSLSHGDVSIMKAVFFLCVFSPNRRFKDELFSLPFSFFYRGVCATHICPQTSNWLIVYEPHHEITCLYHMWPTKMHPRSLISTFVVRCLDSIISLSFYIQNFKPLASFCSWAGRFDLKPRRQVFSDDVATMPFHFSLSSPALREPPNPIPIHSLMLSSHLLFCLPLLLAPFTVLCRIVFAMPEDLEMWPYHLSFRFFTMVRPIAFWILLRTSLFVTWSL